MTIRQRWRQFVRNLLGLQKSEEVSLKYHQVIERETELLKKRREKLGLEEAKELENNKFGIAMSGGGIRSATINLGFLETLNEFNLLQRADYISTVSGGGYTGAYVQATLKHEEGDYSKLFDKEHIEDIRGKGEYMIPGKGYKKFINRIILIVGFLISLLMSWLSPFIIGMMGYLGYLLLNRFGLDRGNYGEAIDFLYYIIVPVGLVLLFFHFIINVLMNYNLHVSNFFNKLEAAAVVIVLVIIGGVFLFNLNLNWDNMNDQFGEVSYYLLIIFALFVLGYFANPNALSFHRFYRNQLADAFLSKSGNQKNILLQNLLEKKEDGKDAFIYAPYPLINTCLNLLYTNTRKESKKKTSDPEFNFAGSKTNDYFLLSPLFCGSKLTTYVPTSDTYNYRDLTLPAAATISAAAVNPGMGVYSNKILSILTTVFNARLGYWILNPKKTKLYDSLVWWPRYFVYELLGKIGDENEMLNISDGGHIENLAIYELLRRRCKLILAIDAAADPKFTFSEFENLTIRARNELGLEIRFSKNQLEDEIRPKPSVGYSNKRFAVAEVFYLWEEIMLRDDSENLILDKNGNPIEVLINYKKYDSNPDTDEAVEDIMESIHEGVEAKIMDMTKAQQALDGVKKIVKERLETDLKMGTLVYVKSSLTAPRGKQNVTKKKDKLRYFTYKYKVYHPDFPHESTADQFFDLVQWTAYYDLGRFICADVLGIDVLDKYLRELDPEERPNVGINELMNRRFGRRVKIFEEYKQQLEEEKERKAELLKAQLEEDFPMEKSMGPATMRELEPLMEEANSAEELTENHPPPAALEVTEEVKADSSKIVVGEDFDYRM